MSQRNDKKYGVKIYYKSGSIIKLPEGSSFDHTFKLLKEYKKYCKENKQKIFDFTFGNSTDDVIIIDFQNVETITSGIKTNNTLDEE